MVSKGISWDSIEIPHVCFPQLDAIRLLFKNDTLQPSDVQKLIYQATLLLSFARHTMKKDITTLRPSKAASVAATMLMVVDALYAAGAALGPKSGVHTWWKLLMDTIPPNKVRKERKSEEQKVLENLDLLEQVLEVLETYRTGSRPPARILVPLKRRVICISPLHRFRDIWWDRWRDDDKKWQETN